MTTSTLALYLVPDMLTADECSKLIARFDTDDAEALRTRSRIQFDDLELAEAIATRFPPDILCEVNDEFGCKWLRRGINTHFRLVKYTEGQHFARHEDGFVYVEPPYDTKVFRTFVSVNIYLNDVPPERGGETFFIDHCVSVHPKMGTASVFQVDNIFHEGKAVKSGEKYILRTDIVYELSTKVEHINRICIDLQKKLSTLWLAARENDSENAWNEYQTTLIELKRASEDDRESKQEWESIVKEIYESENLV
jgi:hypothetical protein